MRHHFHLSLLCKCSDRCIQTYKQTDITLPPALKLFVVVVVLQIIFSARYTACPNSTNARLITRNTAVKMPVPKWLSSESTSAPHSNALIRTLHNSTSSSSRNVTPQYVYTHTHARRVRSDVATLLLLFCTYKMRIDETFDLFLADLEFLCYRNRLLRWGGFRQDFCFPALVRPSFQLVKITGCFEVHPDAENLVKMFLCDWVKHFVGLYVLMRPFYQYYCFSFSWVQS